jgi:hypothetical protein
LVTYRNNWSERRVYFEDETGKLCSIPLLWTSVTGPDPFVAAAKGRSALHFEDLRELAVLVARLWS